MGKFGCANTSNCEISNITGLFEESFFDYQELESNLKQLLAKEGQPLSKMVIRCVIDLLISLPQYKESNVVNELDLKIRYLNPVLKYFCDDVKKKFKLRWPESNPAERKVRYSVQIFLSPLYLIQLTAKTLPTVKSSPHYIKIVLNH
ncbi:hypothetical protein MUCCIDRAFT_78999 [Mucor lusitanicus CBS 277.49]|uniref:Uncharacterized protein n=1 Tax=Mucor lusitanicus CBS 277.49 TaxID=747725 RepID=A0A162MVM0_MUCCL|nr:hypothetical protein MUCCIDRAFT_78999 [Mucor lusitanicus CBS 277.49]